MVTARIINRWLWGSLVMMGLLLLVACSEDSSDDTPQRGNLRLLSVTRTDDEHTHLEEGDIRLFVTTDKTFQSGNFNWTTGRWESTDLSVKENTQYYFYGYWPNTIEGSLSAYNDEFSNGADLTLNNLPVFTDMDVLIIVGVQKVAEDENHIVDNPHTVATQGEFGYYSGLAGNNYVNLLMDHLYSQLKLQFCVDKDYYALRRIHLKTVTLKSSYVAKDVKVTATVNLRASEGLADRVSFSDPAIPDEENPITPETWPLLKAGDSDLGAIGYIDLPSEEATPQVLTQTVKCPYRLFDTDGTYLTIVSTYDVYDAAGTTLIRENQTVINKVKVSSLMAPGMLKTLTLTVTPTYLYVLADPDLDTPTATIKE